MKLLVNGLEIPVENTIDILVIVDPAGDRLENATIKIVGGELTIDNPNGPALHVDVDNGGKLHLLGTRPTSMRQPTDWSGNTPGICDLGGKNETG